MKFPQIEDESRDERKHKDFLYPPPPPSHRNLPCVHDRASCVKHVSGCEQHDTVRSNIINLADKAGYRQSYGRTQ